MQRWRLANGNIGKPCNIIWERGGWEKGRERKEKTGEEREIICLASSVEQANEIFGVLGALVLKYLSILQHSQRHKSYQRAVPALGKKGEQACWFICEVVVFSASLMRDFKHQFLLLEKAEVRPCCGHKWGQGSQFICKSSNLYIEEQREGLQRLWV